MTVKSMTTIERFIGLSSDEKPIGVPGGSIFLETDTLDSYVCYDGTNWTKGKRNSVANSVGDMNK